MLLHEHQFVPVLIILTYQAVFAQLPGPSGSKYDQSCEGMQREEQSISIKGLIFLGQVFKISLFILINLHYYVLLVACICPAPGRICTQGKPSRVFPL